MPESYLGKGIDARLDAVIATLDASGKSAGAHGREARLATLIESETPDSWWLALCVIRGRLPSSDDVRDVALAAFERGVAAVLQQELSAARERAPASVPEVEIVVDAVTVDVHHTSRAAHFTGIQRVVRETVPRWQARHDLILVGWADDYRHMVALPQQALTSEKTPQDEQPGRVLVPWRGVHLLPELTAEPARAVRLAALAHFSRCQIGLIGYDTVPISSSETVAPGMSVAFAGHLATVRKSSRIAAISSASASEFDGWRRMLVASGTGGPDVRAIPLATERGDDDSEDLSNDVSALLPNDLPLVLCVGSHEPRKNHLAVLHAAEVLWRQGRTFALLFLGGFGWKGERFEQHVAELQEEGRPLAAVRAVTDHTLHRAYERARFLVFPSLNEGFGLPVVEALAHGTPVVTSDYGSTREIIADGGGGLLVNPRDDAAIVAAMDRLLVDDDLHDELAAAARARPIRTWDDYARDTWSYLTGTDDAGVSEGGLVLGTETVS